MSCNCDELSGKLNQINSKIDGLLAENSNLKRQLAETNKNAVTKNNFGKLLQNQNALIGTIALGAFTTQSGIRPRDIAGRLQKITSLERLFNNVKEWAKFKPSNFFTKGQAGKLSSEILRASNIANAANQRSINAAAEAGRAWNASTEQRKLLRSLEKGLNNFTKAADQARRSVEDRLRSQINALRAQNAQLNKAINAAQATANKAASIANKLAPLMSFVSVLLSLASTAISVGTLYALGGRINQVESQLRYLEKEISGIIGRILTPLKFRLDRLEARLGDSSEISAFKSQLLSLSRSLNSRIEQLPTFTDLNVIKSQLAGIATSVAVGTISGIAINAVLSKFPFIGNGGGGQQTIIRERVIKEVPTIIRVPQPYPVTNTVTNNRIIERTNTIERVRVEKVNVPQPYPVTNMRNVISTKIQKVEVPTPYPVTNTRIIENTRVVQSPSSSVDYNRIQTVVRGEVAPAIAASNATRAEVGKVGRQTSLLPALSLRISDKLDEVKRLLLPIGTNVENIKKKAQSLYNNQFVQSAMSTLNTAFLVHNALRLSFDAGQFVGDVVGQVLSSVGVTFKDENENVISLNQAVGNIVSNAVDAVIPAAWQSRLNTLWLSSNVILSTGANIYWAMESIADEGRNVAEITNDRLGTWMNTARDEGLVSERAYPHQPPISSKSRYGRYDSFLDKVNRGVGTWENKVNDAEDVVSTISYVASVPVTVGEELTTIQEQRGGMAEKLATIQEEEQQKEEERLLDNEAPVTLESPLDFLGDE